MSIVRNSIVSLDTPKEIIQSIDFATKSQFQFHFLDTVLENNRRPYVEQQDSIQNLQTHMLTVSPQSFTFSSCSLNPVFQAQRLGQKPAKNPIERGVRKSSTHELNAKGATHLNHSLPFRGCTCNDRTPKNGLTVHQTKLSRTDIGMTFKQ